MLQTMIGNEINILGDKCRINTYLDRYASAIDAHLKSHYQEEDFKSTSNKIYNSAIILFSYKYASLIAYLLNFNSYSSLETRFKIYKVKSKLATLGINFDDILSIFSVPRKYNDATDIENILIGNSPIHIESKEFITTTGNNQSEFTIPVVESFLVYSANTISNVDIIGLDIYQHSTAGYLGVVGLPFNDFFDSYPMFLFPVSRQVLEIREYNTQDDITSGFTHMGMVMVDDILYNVYVYRDKTLSNETDPLKLSILFNTIENE